LPHQPFCGFRLSTIRRQGDPATTTIEDVNMTQQPDSAAGNYYVSMRRDDGQTRLLRGPFRNDHAATLAAVSDASSQAERLDPKAVWYCYGTVRMAETYAEPGILDRLEIAP
jgi:hypothetical protein